MSDSPAVRSASVTTAAAGAGGGLVASIATCPLDVVKTKLQAQRAVRGQPGYESVLGPYALPHPPDPYMTFFLCTPDIVKTTLRHDGIRGMYRGLGPTLLGYLPTWAIYFAVYDGIKRHFGEPPLGEPAPSGRIYPAAQPKGYQPVMRDHPWTLHILSAMTAGAASTTCTNPLWVIKTRFMVPRDLIAVIMISCAHAPLPTIRHSPDAK